MKTLDAGKASSNCLANVIPSIEAFNALEYWFALGFPDPQPNNSEPITMEIIYLIISLSMAKVTDSTRRKMTSAISFLEAGHSPKVDDSGSYFR